MNSRVRDCADWLMWTAFWFAVSFFFFHAVWRWHWSPWWLLPCGTALDQAVIYGICAVRSFRANPPENGEPEKEQQ